MSKLRKSVYDADGVEFTIYETEKPTKSGPKVYWVLEEYCTTGKRRLLNNPTRKAAERRADQIRAAAVNGAGRADGVDQRPVAGRLHRPGNRS